MPDFERPRHHLVWQVLEALDRDFLADAACWFAGGTRIVLALDEYRESVDVDFLCADTAGYRAIRSAVTPLSFGPVFARPPRLMREIRTDRYGVRTWLEVDDRPVKLEIVSEGRVALGGHRDAAFPVDVLDRSSCLVQKFLANSDRGRDAATEARDLVDLAFMAAGWCDVDPRAAMATAESVYGTSIRRDLEFVLERFSDTSIRRRCLAALAIEDEATLDIGLERLSSLLGSIDSG